MSSLDTFENVQSYQIPTESEKPIYSGGSMRQIGGVMQYSVGSDDASQTEYQSPAVRSYTDAVTTYSASGAAQSSGVNTVSTSTLTGGQSGFMATARNDGFPAQGNLTADTIVTFQGMEVSLSTLEAMGEVKRTASGSYEAINGQGQGQQQQAPQGAGQPEGQLPEGVELFENAVESSVARAIEPVPQSIYDATVAQVLEKGLDGVNLNDLAYQSGLTPEEAMSRAQVVLKAFTLQADNLAKDSGIDDPQAAWGWMAQNRPDEFSNARRQIAFGRSTAAIRSLLADYRQSVPPSEAALRKAGIPVRTSPDGTTTAYIKGQWTTPAAAAKAGLI